ncbi:MAG: hypothetical protein HXM37_06470 [Isoptericola variabilis]|nr:hypothetical protein [Isoptericola variabilis]
MAVVMDPQMPTGTEVASYETYAQARAGVDFLSDAGFDVSMITIVGSDLHLVERVKGRLTIARASLSGASSGGLWGALGGMLMSAGQSAGGTGTWVAGGIIVGALIGMALSALSFIIRGRSRDLVSSQQVVAQRYAVLASADIDRAYQILQRTPGNRARVVRQRTEEQREKKDSVGFFPDGRPRFGAATKDGEVPGGSPDTDAYEAVVTSAAPESSAPAVTTPETAPAEHEDAPASSREDQTEA